MNDNDEAEGDLVKLVADRLMEKGYKTVTHVGRSQFKIDIAVVNPDKPEEYMMGILCDGRNYYETKTTRDREIVQPGVLAGLGWNVMRVWAVDWYSNNDQVMSRILQRLEDIKHHVKVQNIELDEEGYLNLSFPEEPELPDGEADGAEEEENGGDPLLPENDPFLETDLPLSQLAEPDAGGEADPEKPGEDPGETLPEA